MLTSFHQSPLPTALCCGWPGVARITGASRRLPRALLDVRLRPGEDLPETPEPERCGHRGRRRLPATTTAPRRRPPPAVGDLVPDGRYVVVHPGPRYRPAPARRTGRRPWRCSSRKGGASWSPAGRPSAASPPRSPAARHRPRRPHRPRRSWPACWPAPPRSSSATPARRTWPRRSARRWSRSSRRSSPPCAGRRTGCRTSCSATSTARAAASRARECPVPGHPCLASVTPETVVGAVAALAGAPLEVPA